jgi:hypothetical protein
VFRKWLNLTSIPIHNAILSTKVSESSRLVAIGQYNILEWLLTSVQDDVIDMRDERIQARKEQQPIDEVTGLNG